MGCSNFYGQNISRQTTIGTRLYYSPEIMGQEEQNDRLDVWCVGVVLYELLFLEQPFTGQEIELKIRVFSNLSRNVSIIFQDTTLLSQSLKICLGGYLRIKVID